MTADIHQKSLSRTEKFGLITGLVGLIADTITLGTLLIIRPQNHNATSIYALILLVTGLTLIYGWIILAWTFVRHNLNYCSDNTERYKKFYEDQTWIASTIGVGLLLTPLAITWLMTILLGSPSPTQQPTEPTHLTITSPTPTKRPTQTPALTSTTGRTIEPMSNTENAVMGTLFLIIIFYPIIGLGVAFCLYTLMPLAYIDLPISPP